ncbi:NAD(P)H-dependent oxidoreductase [Cupriavidus basilensis]|uniref:FMN dependent NADH:quinone oxidoreductase n=1 Tax=Cupriavidus basilensis TaxID=68895 RepID=A0ABT6AUX6_9BURK|nr:NAD(P)H-dependent oxidoreductase [Cupriavidus basilensis]MDF3836415.1 NAD(P)H-dependent oxidoreductase [Cupriavidus basilensis]
MTRLLHISASARGESSFSRQAAQRLLAQVARQHPALAVSERDLGLAPPPHPPAALVEASLMPAAQRGAAETAALAQSEAWSAELEAADVVLISTPMHNFTVPSALKAWIDHVVRIDRTFRSTPGGKIGLLADRPVWLLLACGGPLGDGPAAQRDFLTPYLRYVLACTGIGLARFEALRLDQLRRGSEHVAQGMARVDAWAGHLARQLHGAGADRGRGV